MLAINLSFAFKICFHIWGIALSGNDAGVKKCLHFNIYDPGGFILPFTDVSELKGNGATPA